MAAASWFWTVQVEDFQENILGGVILIYNCYSEQSVCNLTKRMTLSPVFPGEIFEYEWLWTANSELGGVILVYNHYSEQPIYNLTKRRNLPPLFSREIFENGWLWTAASEQSKIAACNVIQFLTIKISFRILL